MKKSRPLIGIIAAEAEYVFFSNALNTIQKELFAANMDAAVFSSLMMSGNAEFDAAENSVYDLVDFDLLDGIIIFSSSINDVTSRERLIARIKSDFKGPVVSFDSQVDGFANCLYNYEPVADMMVSHIMDHHGCKVIDFVGGPKDEFHDSIERYFVKAMKKRGYDIPKERIHHGIDWVYDFSGIAGEIISNGMPEAIMCCSDLTAVQLIESLSNRGVNIPDDVLITGFNQKEPYGANYLNITSALRDPVTLAKNAAHYIIAKVTGGVYQAHSDDNCAQFRVGMTCGCCPPNLGGLCHAFAAEMTSLQGNEMDSYYNFMSEELIGADTFYDYLWKVDWYTHFLGDFTGFWLCLNNQVMHNEAPEPGFTDRINLAYKRTSAGSTVDLMAKFPRDMLLPEIFEERSRPSAFIFTTLHFIGVNYGYVVLSYGESGKSTAGITSSGSGQ